MGDFGFFQNGGIEITGFTLYLCDILSKGVFSGIGKDLWEDIKKKPIKKSEEGLIQSFEKEPNLPANVNKLTFLLETWLEEDGVFKDKLYNIIKNNTNKSESNSVSLGDLNKNTVVHSNLSNNSGTIKIGDN